MAMYYYARKLSKGPSSSSSTSRHSSSSRKTPPPHMNINGSIPCCSHTQSNGPVGLPPPPPCVMMGMNGGLVQGGNYRFQQQHHQPHHHHHPHEPPSHQHHQHPPHQQQHHPHHQQCRYSQQLQQQQQQTRYAHFLNGPCCCGGGTTTPSLPRRQAHSHPTPPMSSAAEGVEDSCFFYDDEDYDNECEIPVPVLCKVHNNSIPSTSNSGGAADTFCDKGRGSFAGGGTCGLATAGSSFSPTSDDDNLSPPEENKDLIFNGPHLISGTWEALVQHLLPTQAHFPSEDFIFTYLLSARVYIQPHELLGRIFHEVIDISGGTGPGPPHSPHHSENSQRSSSTSPQHQRPTTSTAAAVIGTTFTNATGLTDLPEINEEDYDLPLNVIPLLVQFLRPWTEFFPFDFRDDRMMAHVRILAHKCVASDEEVREQVSQLLAALLSRLAALEKYEEFLHRVTTETSIGEPIAAPSVVTICPDPATMAEQLTLVELQRFSFIGPEEFVQTLGKEDLKTGVRHCDCVNRKTKNLEAYVRWFQRLTYYVASEICKMSKKKSRCRVCEYWVQVAKECLNIRNFNSLMAILAGLNILPVARLKKTWTKPLYTELAEVAKAVDPQQNYAPYRKLYKAAVWQGTSGSSTSLQSDKQTYRILVPYFSLLMKDIYNLDSVHPSRLPNGHIDYDKCRQLAKLVREITSWQKVSCDFVQIQSIFNSVQASPIFNEQELIYASYLCEQPETAREKEQFKKLHRQNFQVPLIACNSSSENDT